MFMPFLECISFIPLALSWRRIALTPSHFTSKTQSLLSNGISTWLANIGLIDRGNGELYFLLSFVVLSSSITRFPSVRDFFCFGLFPDSCSFVFPERTDSGELTVRSL